MKQFFQSLKVGKKKKKKLSRGKEQITVPTIKYTVEKMAWRTNITRST